MRHRGIRGTAVIAAAIATFITPATASAGVLDSILGNMPGGQTAKGTCGSAPQKIWQAFMAWGDKADYWLAPGGDFESGADGWKLDNARVVRGNDGQGVVDGKKSLAIGMGLVSLRGTAVSPTFCIGEEHPTFRYMVKANGTVGVMTTWVRYTAVDGSTQEEQVYSNGAATLLPGKWAPSDLQPLATRLPMKKMGGVAKVQLVFRVPLSAVGAGYQIDNVLVDPYRMR